MRIFKFLDTEFVITSKKIGEAKGLEYSLMDAGKLQAAQTLIGWARSIAKYIQIIKLLAKYFLIKLKLLTPPVSPLDQQLNKAQTEEQTNGSIEGTQEKVGAQA
jgi:hypothetical protein